MRPVLTLREYGVALRASLDACAQHPTPTHVHHLRTGIRRVEALLDLLPRLAGLPHVTREAARLRKAAAPLRRAAGVTRDLDVLLGLLAQPSAPRQAEIESGGAHLVLKLERRRKRSARRLTALIADKHSKLLHALDALELALVDAKQAAAATEIDRIALAIFRHATAQSTARSLARSANALHTLRKAAKLTRYLTEAAGKNAVTTRTAQRFHAVQEKIGCWHDWLLLSDFAAQHLEDDHPLLRTLQARKKRTHATALRAAQLLLRA